MALRYYRGSCIRWQRWYKCLCERLSAEAGSRVMSISVVLYISKDLEYMFQTT